MGKYLIHYFSGTGNTFHMVKILERELRDNGQEVDLLNIEKDQKIKINEYSFHIFCFPVYGFGTPSMMLRYISRLKAAAGDKAVILCTSAGAEGQSLNHVKHMLSKKGYEVFFTDMLIYTYNFTQLLNPQSKETEERVFKAAEAKLIEITKRIINNEKDYKKTNPIVLILGWLVLPLYINFARRILGRVYIADDSCIGCGKCKNVCPSKVISMYNGRPKWSYNCQSCQRCINICPEKSIQLSIIKLAIFAIAELMPILIIIDINNYIYNLPLILNIIFLCVMFLTATLISNALIVIMEKVPVFKKLFQINYTKKYRRNIAAGFDIK